MKYLSHSPVVSENLRSKNRKKNIKIAGLIFDICRNLQLGIKNDKTSRTKRIVEHLDYVASCFPITVHGLLACVGVHALPELAAGESDATHRVIGASILHKAELPCRLREVASGDCR